MTSFVSKNTEQSKAFLYKSLVDQLQCFRSSQKCGGGGYDISESNETESKVSVSSEKRKEEKTIREFRIRKNHGAVREAVEKQN